MDKSLTPQEIEVLKDLRIIYEASLKLEFIEERAIWYEVIIPRCAKLGLDIAYIIMDKWVFDMLIDKSIKLATY